MILIGKRKRIFRSVLRSTAIRIFIRSSPPTTHPDDAFFQLAIPSHPVQNLTCLPHPPSPTPPIFSSNHVTLTTLFQHHIIHNVVQTLLLSQPTLATSSCQSSISILPSIIMHITLAPTSLPSATPVTFETFSEFAISLTDALPLTAPCFSPDTPVQTALSSFLSLDLVNRFLINVSRADVFSPDTTARFSDSSDALLLLRALKHLKYSYNLPLGHLCETLSIVLTVFGSEYASHFSAFARRVLDHPRFSSLLMKHFTIARDSPEALSKLYQPNADYLVENDPHAIFPTSIYRQCVGNVASTDDSRSIEAVMSTTVTTTIRIDRGVLDPASTHLSEVYKPLSRCVAVVDERLDTLYGPALENYFAAHSIAFEKLVYRCMEVDKDISTVERILVDLKSRHVSRNEPILVVGGGVLADIGGFACALYHRNTPYVMLCTSIVSGIDAGPSPRTCCDGLGYKNVFGAYHPPILTLTDRSFFKTLHPGWIRHGIAEIVKMAVTKDASLFDCLEEAGDRLVQTKFGVEECQQGSEFDNLCETIIAKAMDSYVRSEYGNLWETHQCRPHAYGHTWSPGFELQAGLLHGHAVAIGMGYGAYLSLLKGWITEAEFHRILKVMCSVGLSLRHSILENGDSLWASQVKMTEKRGGNLCAPIPRGGIGKCGYLNELSRERLEQTLAEYQNIVKKYPREGLGIDPHCHDVGLEDPSTVKQHAENAVKKGSISCDETPTAKAEEVVVESNGTTPDTTNIAVYNKWIAEKQQLRNSDKQTSSAIGAEFGSVRREDTPHAPIYDHTTLFHDEVEEYACAMTTKPSEDFDRIAAETDKANLFAPCMVGGVEGQFLKMIAGMCGAKRVLDIGTFTGYSALAFAEGVGNGGEVLSVEADSATVEVARKCLGQAKYGGRVKVVEADARVFVKGLVEQGEKFDIVFLDADKTNYRNYYEDGLQLLSEGGVLLADNALCSLVYAADDPVSQSLHEFAQYVRADERVEQVMLTVREGILVVRKVCE